MTSWDVIGALTFIVCFALLVLFLSWDSRNDGGFGSIWFSPDKIKDDIDKKSWSILITMLILVIIILLIILF